MDGRGGCCIAQYAGGAYDMSQVDRIMLRYRPIAPKPAVSGAATGSSTPENKESVFRPGRTKRRYVKDNNKRSNRKRRVFSEEKKDGLDDATVVTLLPLLPEMPDRKEIPARNSPSDLDLKVAATTPPTETASSVRYAPIWLNGPTTVVKPGDAVVDRMLVVTPHPVRPVGSFVTVERVTEAYVDAEGLGNTDEEKRKNLERDTCPGFISNGLNTVEWTNEAYKRLIGEGERQRDGRPEMVWLMTKERLPLTCPAFACPVRLQYTCRKERHSLTVPCDVWRMDGGGFAWRLDVKAALSLGR